MKNLSIRVKILFFVISIVIVGDIAFTSFSLYYSRNFLVNEMKQTLLGFSKTVALDIARGYEINNTRSLYSLLDELEHFDNRILTLTVLDSNAVVTADIKSDKLFSRDSSTAVLHVLRTKNEYIEFDESRKEAIVAVPINHTHAGITLGVFKATFSIQGLYSVLSNLQQIIIIVSLIIFTFLVFGLLLMTRNIIVKPLQRFLPVLERIQRGDFSVTLPIMNNDEIGVLSRHVNQMAVGLKEREFVKDSFSRYVPKEVVEQLLERKISPRLEGELRNVTIFFSDIRGFTKMTERLGAEQIVKILNRYFTAMTDVVLQYDGIIDKFSGDEIMVIFGAPLSHEDDPIRAVAMGVAMQKRLEQVNNEFERDGMERISIGIGINTGTAIAGNIGSEKRLTYSVIGDDVNLASRLVDKAQEGEIIISEATYVHIKEHFRCQALGELMVKGKSLPIPMYRVIQEMKAS